MCDPLGTEKNSFSPPFVNLFFEEKEELFVKFLLLNKNFTCYNGAKQRNEAH